MSRTRVHTAIAASKFFYIWQKAQNPLPEPTTDFRHANLPEGWEECGYEHKGLNVECYALEADKPRAHINIMMGFNGAPAKLLHIAPKLSEILRAMECSAIIMAPPYMNGSPEFFRSFYDVERTFLLDEDSPANQMGGRNVPRYVVTHSVSGHMLQTMLQHRDTAAQLKERLMGAININPFFAAAYASHLYDPENYEIYLDHSERYHNVVAGGALLDRAWLKLKRAQPEKDPASYINPSHGQVRQLVLNGRDLLDSMEPHEDFPQYFIFGENDAYACPKAGIYAAKRMGAEFHILDDAGHNTLASVTEETMMLANGFVTEMNKRFVPPQPAPKDEPSTVVYPGFWDMVKNPARLFSRWRRRAQAAADALPASLEQAL